MNDRLRNRQNKEERKYMRKFSIFLKKKCTGDKKAKPNALLISQQTKRKPARK